MKKYISIGLLVIALFLGCLGVTTFSNSGGSVEIVGIELSAENSKKKTTSLIYMGFDLVSDTGGLYLMKGSKT